MIKRIYIPAVITCLLLFVSGCNNINCSKQGKLFIIGGGERPPELMQKMLDASGLLLKDYIVILPFASNEQVEVSTIVTEQFHDLGFKNIRTLFLNADTLLAKSSLDSVRNARLIYITGGDQNLFMKTAAKTGLTEAVQQAYTRGAMIAGTSAGAAVMSKKMITGNQLSYAEYTNNFRTIHQNNIEIKAGLGLLDHSIIDQHFIQRMRMNRLLSVAIENPDEMCIGIDESTAILVEGNRAKVVGSSQVIVLTNGSKESETKNGLLGAKDLRIQVLLPGDVFKIR
ncbi:MAG: cyanophycinase [Bacteroidales bacterium]|nr:cyanophycinase [Bacteroidales bacterium]